MCKLLSVRENFRELRAVLCALAVAGLASVSQALELVPVPDILQTSQRWLDDNLAALSAGEALPLRVKVTLGALDSRLRLAPCSRVEPYIPPGARLWGKTRLGLRCAEGTVRWNVFLPVTVQAFGNAWVVKGDLAPGHVLSESDATQAEVDWAQEVSPVVADPAKWVGQVTTRLLTTGQVLRQSVLKPAQVFQAGAPVRVLASGSGFQIVSDGQAVSSGVVGQSVRVRMDNGRILLGTVLDARSVKVDL